MIRWMLACLLFLTASAASAQSPVDEMFRMRQAQFRAFSQNYVPGSNPWNRPAPRFYRFQTPYGFYYGWGRSNGRDNGFYRAVPANPMMFGMPNRW